ncbi:MAG: ABC transporter substrate-binding protein, partial [Candidatus Thorarchaeota archaeon]
EKYNLKNEIKVKNYGQAEFIAKDMRDGLLEGGVGTPALAVFTSTLMESNLIIEAKDLCSNNPSYGIFAHEKLIRSHPDLILKFLKYHKTASNLLRTSPSIAAEKISKTFEIINKKYAEAVIKISPKYCISLSESYLKSTMDFVKVLYNLGYIKKRLEKENIFDLKFVNLIHPEPEHYS